MILYHMRCIRKWARSRIINEKKNQEKEKEGQEK